MSAARDTLACPLELKFAGGTEREGTFAGYGAVFGNVDSYGDVIAKGAFAETLRAAQSSGTWPAMLMQHGGLGVTADDFTPIGIWTDLREDDRGLYVEGKLALDTTRGADAYALLTMQPRPALNGLSIGYVAKEWAVRTKPEEPRRTLKRVDLLEVSLVTFPANTRARVSHVKSLRDPSEIKTPSDFERFLRDAGFSRSIAKAVTSHGFKAAASLRDVDGEAVAQLVCDIEARTATLNNRFVKG